MGFGVGPDSRACVLAVPFNWSGLNSYTHGLISEKLFSGLIPMKQVEGHTGINPTEASWCN